MSAASPPRSPTTPRLFTDEERARFIPDAPMSYSANPAPDNPTKEDRPF